MATSQRGYSSATGAIDHPPRSHHLSLPKGGRLKVVLASGDALAVAIGYTVVVVGAGYAEAEGILRSVFVIGGAVVIGVLAMRSQGLLLARVSAVRIVEMTHVTRAAGLLLVGMLAFDRIAGLGFHVRYMVLAGVIAWLCTVASRSVFRAWISVKRANGKHQRSVVVVGCDGEAARLVELFAAHTDLGILVLGVVGDRDAAARNGLAALWLGTADEAERVVLDAKASGVVVSPGALSAARLHSFIRYLQAADVHVQLATGVSGIDGQRLRSLPMSHEPLLYVEAPHLSWLQVAMKRTFDLVSATLVLVLALPLLLVVALAVKVHDGGPVLFRQERVGRGGARFELLKFRTMNVDAEAQQALLQEANERDGPLFKLSHDPRVTSLGRFLRRTSIDEFPQLINVIRGEMSLVGPRPALPSEVERFEPELRQREQVLPGITGMWQVEARDNPSFDEYRRLDLFYVENWSMTLDLLIIVATIEHLVLRMLSSAKPDLQSTTSPSGDVSPSRRVA